MCKRLAILIASPFAPFDPTEDIPGVKNDIKKWRSFLSSPTGGCWNELEIYEYKDDDVPLCDYIRSLSGNYDYLFLVYSGHGYANVHNDYIYQKKNDPVSVAEVKNAVKEKVSKGCVVIDACRSNQFIWPDVCAASIPYSPSMIESRFSNEQFQKKWWELFNVCKSDGVVLIQSCEKKYQSFMKKNKNSSMFSDMLLEQGDKNAWTPEKENLSIGEAFIHAQFKTYQAVKNEKNERQYPVCDNEDVDYPFAILRLS